MSATLRDSRTLPPTELLQHLHNSQNILCISHVAPDGDAVGSLLGMGWLLRSLGKNPTISLPDPASEDFNYIPGYDDIVGPEKVGDDYDLVVCLDASSPDRMGSSYRPEDHSKAPLMVIDHHITNTYFGEINWVAPDCAATSQMLLYLADALEVEATGPLAVALLTGLVTDTLCFRTKGTDDRVLHAAMRLIQGGAELHPIVSSTLDRRPFELVRLWAEVLPQVQLEDGIIWTLLSDDAQQRANTESLYRSGLAGFLITVREADISATFTQHIDEQGESQIECSFRAKAGFDVSEVALAYGGGGHPPAAGCRVKGSLDSVAERVVASLKVARSEQIARRADSVTKDELLHG